MRAVGEFAIEIFQLIAVLLSYEWVQSLLIPVLVTIAAYAFKRLSRWGLKGNYDDTIEDRLVGFELGLTACVALMVSMAKLSVKIQVIEGEIASRTLSATVESLRNLHEQENSLFAALIGAIVLLVIFLCGLSFLAYLVGKKGWAGSPRQLTKKYVYSVDAVGFLLLVITTFWLGEPR